MPIMSIFTIYTIKRHLRSVTGCSVGISTSSHHRVVSRKLSALSAEAPHAHPLLPHVLAVVWCGVLALSVGLSPRACQGWWRSVDRSGVAAVSSGAGNGTL